MYAPICSYQIGHKLWIFTSAAHLGSLNLPCGERLFGLVGTVGIRTYFADFHSFHKPHQQKAPFRIGFPDLFSCFVDRRTACWNCE